MYGTLVSACEKSGQWTQALVLLDLLRKRMLQEDVVLFNALISACEKCEEWQRSLLLLAELEADASLRPNVITYNAVMSSCGQGTKWDISLYLLFLMRRSLLSADLISYNAAISACEAGQQWQAAVHLVSEVQQARLHGDAISLTAAIAACGRGLAWPQALQLYHDFGGKLNLPGSLIIVLRAADHQHDATSDSPSSAARLVCSSDSDFLLSTAEVWPIQLFWLMAGAELRLRGRRSDQTCPMSITIDSIDVR
ncbi:Pentatricopeptide repeat-containing protein At2g31400 [Durusdinium trenchii]|uniref:Chloroplastic n=1 Tax=Durusdinium trenchii TaxID=1381693 RepID=A0ABP0Q6L6_9DINO